MVGILLPVRHHFTIIFVRGTVSQVFQNVSDGKSKSVEESANDNSYVDSALSN